MNLPEDLVTPSQAARLVDVHPGTVWAWIRAGRLPVWRVGGCRYWLSTADVLAVAQPVREKRPPWAWRD
jgi:excisionase family DNA binding protein